jgi:integrase
MSFLASSARRADSTFDVADRADRRVLSPVAFEDRWRDLIGADERHQRAPDRPSARRGDRGHRPQGLADARTAPPPRTRPGRSHAADRRSSHHGAVGILRSLSAMAEDAITDEVCDSIPSRASASEQNDPRAKKKPRPIRVFSFEEMHRFAKAAGRYEAMVRVFTDTGLRLGEVLPLCREDFDGETLQVRRTAHEGVILDGTKTDHGEPDAGRIVPVPATLHGCSKPRSISTAPTATFSSRPQAAASGASATSTATSGSRPRKPPI